MEKLIQLENVVVRSGNFEVLSGANVTIPQGKSTVIMGPSGCGKSTLLKVAAGIIIPESGKVYLKGENLFKLSEKALLAFRKQNGFVFQDAALWANKTIFDNLALPLKLHHRDLSPDELNRKVISLLQKMNLDDSPQLHPAQLSFGERKLASFLRAVIMEPSILFLDDPTTSIDHEMLEIMMQMIKELKQGGCTIIAVTHDAHLASMIADYLIILKEGIILMEGEIDEVRKSTDQKIISVLSEVLSEAATYDTDLLDLLGGHTGLKT